MSEFKKECNECILNNFCYYQDENFVEGCEADILFQDTIKEIKKGQKC